MGCFNARRSDVDLLVLLHGGTLPAGRRELARLLLRSSGRPYPVELTVVRRSDLLPWHHPASFDLHWSESYREAFARALGAGGDPRAAQPAVDADLAVQVASTRERGRCLAGAPADELLPVVPRRDVLDSILADLAWIEERSTGAYGVLNACRGLAYVRGAGLLSKAEGAAWALRALPAPLHGPIRAALAAYLGSGADPGADELRAFVARVAPLIRREAIDTSPS